MSEANRTCGRGSDNIASPSKSENCQGNFRDLQKDLVVLSYLMLLLTSPSATRPPLLKGEALSKITLSNGSSKAPTPTNKKALLIGEAGGQRLLCKLDVERSETGVRLRGLRHPNTQRDPSVVGEPLPRLFSPVTVEKRFDFAAVSIASPYLTNISPLRSG